jgi:cyclophilin family peptidyl-prolyl cis-trans isomerase
MRLEAPPASTTPTGDSMRRATEEGELVMNLSLVAVVLVLAILGSGSAAAQNNPSAKANPRVALDTTKGKVVLELFQDKAPKSVENFLQYVKSGHYDGVIFHRVIPDFMVQGGGFTPDMTQKETRPPIQNEADNGLRNERGTVAMARTNDPHSASAQFFINLKNNRFLDHTGKNPQGWGYAVFGKVVEGMDVVDAIAKVRTTTKGPYGDVPVEAITIKKASVVPAG